MSSEEEKAHKELLVLLQDAARARDFYKKATFSYLIYYSAIAALILHLFYKDCSILDNAKEVILGLLFLGAVFCAILIHSSDDNFCTSREAANRVFRNLTFIFRWCRDPQDLEIKNKKDKINRLIYYMATSYPFLVWGLVFILFYKIDNYLQILSLVLTPLIFLLMCVIEIMSKKEKI
jgi:hypothetical protein